MDAGSWHCTGDGDQDNPQEKEMQKSKMIFWGDLTNSWEKKGIDRQRRKIYPTECRIIKNSKEKKKKAFLPKWSMQRNRGK